MSTSLLGEIFNFTTIILIKSLIKACVEILIVRFY